MTLAIFTLWQAVVAMEATPVTNNYIIPVVHAMGYLEWYSLLFISDDLYFLLLITSISLLLFNTF